MKKLIKWLLFLITLCIITFLILFFIKKENKFEKLGYSPSQIKVINKLDNPEIVLNFDYNEFIIELINHKDFIEKNLSKYIEFSSKYSFNIDDIVYVINKDYYKENIDYSSKVIALTKEDYFIFNNLERYISYLENNQELDNYNIILNVNCNLDYSFYTNTKEVDLSKGYLMLVNKYHYLSETFVPDNLVKIESKYGVTQELDSVVYEEYKKMWNDAHNIGLTLYINSPYRSYNTQKYLYNNYGLKDGYTLADTYSARPGFSEHQTGYAVDVTSKSTNFSNFEYSSEYKWLEDNAYKYGFILRYPKGKEYITGYQYEPWHYRYVGKEIANKIKELNITFEEYYAYYLK